MSAGVAGVDSRQRWGTVNVQLLAADSAKTIQAARTSPIQITVKFIEVIIRTSAAQAIDIQDASGAVVFGTIPASAAVGAKFTFGPYETGVDLPAGQALRAIPVAPGPAAAINAEGYFEGIS